MPKITRNIDIQVYTIYEVINALYGRYNLQDREIEEKILELIKFLEVKLHFNEDYECDIIKEEILHITYLDNKKDIRN